MTADIDRCLDAGAMRALLQGVLPECAAGRWQVERVGVEKARRSASIRRNPHPLTVCYELVLREAASGRTATRRLYAKVYRDGASATAASGSSAIHLAALDMLLWPWPADPGLPQLPELLDPRAAQAWWGRSAIWAQVLRHEPERRATLRYDDAAGSAQAYAKTFSDGRGAAIHARFRHFWQRACAEPAAPLVAEPLGYCDRTRTVWQAGAPGVPLAQALPTGRLDTLPVLLAEALFAVHDAPVALAGATRRDTAHWLAEIRRRQRKIERVSPALAGRAERIAAALEEQAQRLPDHPPALIHGDCHPEQLWIAGSRAVLFDFDEFSLGDPMEDLAEFVTKLGAEGRRRDLGALLLAAYASEHGERFDLNRLHWHAAVQQLLQASRAFVFQVPDWPAELERRLARAEQLCRPQADVAMEVMT